MLTFKGVLTLKSAANSSNVGQSIDHNFLTPLEGFASSPSSSLQVTLAAGAHTEEFEALVAAAPSLSHKACPQLVSGVASGHWLSVTPTLQLSPADVVAAMRLRLELPHPCLVDHSVCTCGHSMDALGTHLLRCSHNRERSAAHDAMRDAMYYIIREAGRAFAGERTSSLPSAIPRGRGGRVDLVISEPASGHTLLDVVIADPTRVDALVP